LTVNLDVFLVDRKRQELSKHVMVLKR